jgi:hypothetical protein
MLTALLLTTLTLAPTEAIQSAQEPPVKVWLDKRGDLERGNRVRVFTRVETDGYLVILHAEADGRIRVLFPLDPFHDNYVRGGQDFEVRGRGDREAFQIYAASGAGTVYAAFSRDPFGFDAFVRNNHWDYRLLETWRLNEGLDAQAELTALAGQMAGEGTYFDYDLTHYGVAQQAASSGGGGRTVYVSGGWGYGYGYPYWGYPYYGGGWGPYFGFGISWGWGSIGWGWGSPYWGWGWPHHYGYYGYYPYYRYGCCYYGGPYYYSGYPYYGYYGSGYYHGGASYNYGVGAYVLPRYTFKHDAQRGLASGGITNWQRSSRSATGGQFASYSRYVGAPSRRTAPTGVGTAAQMAGRRVAPTTGTGTAAQTAGRRIAPATDVRGAGQASTAGRPTIERRAGPTTNAGRQVQPDGWGVTDGRRTIPVTDQRQQPGAAQNTGRRVQQPTNLRERNTPNTQPRGDAGATGGRAAAQRRQIEPGSAARSATGSKAGTRQTLQQRSVSPQRTSPQPPTQSKNSLRSTLRQITSPQRTAPRSGAAPRVSAPAGRPTLERRASPSRAAPRPSPTQIRSQPSSQPSVSPPSRPSTPRPQARPSAPRTPPRSTPRPAARSGPRRP